MEDVRKGVGYCEKFGEVTMIGAIIIVIVLVTLDIITMLGSIRADREREQYWERKRGNDHEET